MLRTSSPRALVQVRHCARPIILAAILAILVPLATPALAGLNQTGKWRGPFVTVEAGSPDTVQGVHDAVLRKGDSTAVVTFGGSGVGLRFGLWTYKPDPLFTVPHVNHIAGPDTEHWRDIFCSGHSVTAQGKLFIVGGDHGGVFDADRAYIFDPTKLEGERWTLLGSNMAQYRWYPSINTIDDGRLLAFSGTQFQQLITFGGTTGTPEDDFNALLVVPNTLKWKTDRTTLLPDNLAPEPRYGHTLTFNQYGQGEHAASRAAALYGGKGTFGGYDALFDSIWVLRRLDDDTTWKWTRVKPADDAVLSHPRNPGERYRHTAMLAADDAIYMFGGLDQNAQALSDVWKLWWDNTAENPTWHWSFIPTSGSIGARAGHAVAYDQYHNRMLIFGGATDSIGTLADDLVWALPLGDSVATWTTPPMRTGRTPNKPTARDGHGMMGDNDDSRKDAPSGFSEFRAMLFGGRGASGLKNDAWFLWFQSPPYDSLEWQQPDTVGTAPLPRANFGSAYDHDLHRMTMFGGDSVLTPAARSSQTWALSFAEGGAIWQHLTGSAAAGLPHEQSYTAVIHDGRDVQARIPEIHNDPGGAGDAWTVLNSAPLQQDNYPFMFEMPDGRILEAGPRYDAFNLGKVSLLNLATASWDTIHFANQDLRSLYSMGSAVMYRPGRVLRCGNRLPGDGGPGSTHTDTLLYDGSTIIGWKPIATDFSGLMDPRAEPNLTVLPTGDVLVTGGMDVYTPQLKPQIWKPYTGVWGAELAPDSAKRNYHSAAMLLPDARILSTGGQDYNLDKIKVTIFEPPYLFDTTGALAPRPSLSGAPDTMRYRKVLTLCTSNAATISNACLIRPGAVTHAFNQDQRYVSLAFSRATDPPRLFVTMPDTSTYAPPGDYLLFVVDSTASGARTVPSVARWVTVRPSGGWDACDSVWPTAITDLDFDVDETDCTLFHLHWTAPGDDGDLVASGPATQYNMKVSTTTISSNWTGGTTLSLTPGTAGTTQTTDVSVAADQTRYIRIKTKDDNNNWSSISNEIRIDGPPLDSDCLGGAGMLAGGGGGSGDRARPAAGLASVQRGEVAALTENTLLSGVARGTRSTDVLRLPSLAPSGGSSYLVRIREVNGYASQMDEAKLLTVDHSSSVYAYIASGRPVLGNRVPPVHAIDSTGTDVTSLVDGGSADVFVGDSAAVLTIQLRADSSVTADPLVVEASGLGWITSGILVKVPDGAGGWRTLERLRPRLHFDELAIDSLASAQVRLFFLGRHKVRFVGRVSRSDEQPTLHWAELLKAQDSRQGDALPSVSAPDTASVVMAGPDTLLLSFAAPPLGEGQTRECFLAVGATPLAPDAITASPLRASGIASLPTRFALWQNQPNPFSFSTTLRFDLPVPAMVRLEIFDIQGRRVKMVANHYYPAGYQAVQWDRRDESGGTARPSVYLYRLTAGAFRAKRKMVLLP